LGRGGFEFGQVRRKCLISSAFLLDRSMTDKQGRGCGKSQENMNPLFIMTCKPIQMVSVFRQGKKRENNRRHVYHSDDPESTLRSYRQRKAKNKHKIREEHRRKGRSVFLVRRKR